MASFLENLITIIFISTVTFVVLDINHSDDFDKSITAKYLNQIGAKDYVSRSLHYVKSSSFYKQYLVPYSTTFVRYFKHYYFIAKKQLFNVVNQSAALFKKHFTSSSEYLDKVVFPVLKKYSLQIWLALQKHYKNLSTLLKEFSLVVSDWLNSNIIKKLPQEHIQKSFVDFVAYTQKMATNSYDWLSTQFQKLLV